MSIATDAPIVPATPADLPAVLGLLSRASLPCEGVADHFTDFLVARAGGAVVGAVGLEQYGPAALLRSLVVAPEWRGRGLGQALTRRILAGARATGVRRVFLLTETAAEFFPRLGFARITRDGVDEAVRQSAEFTTICCVSAACMRRDL